MSGSVFSAVAIFAAALLAALGTFYVLLALVLRASGVGRRLARAVVCALFHRWEYSPEEDAFSCGRCAWRG